MSKDELVTLMRNAWTANGRAGLSSPLSDAQVDMLDAQLGAIVDGMIAAMTSGLPGYSPEWIHEQLGAGVASSSFTLAHTPLSAAGMLVILNGQILTGWTLVGKTLTLADGKTASDELFAHYQAIVLT